MLLLFQGPVDPTCLNPDAEVWTSSHLTLDGSGPAYLQPEQLWTHFSDALTGPEGNLVLRSHTLGLCSAPINGWCWCSGFVPEFDPQSSLLTKAATLTDGEAESDGRLSSPGVCGELGHPAVSGIRRASASSLVPIVHGFKVALCGFQMRRDSS